MVVVVVVCGVRHRVSTAQCRGAVAPTGTCLGWLLDLQCAAKKYSLKFFAIFLATARNFYMDFTYLLLIHNHVKLLNIIVWLLIMTSSKWLLRNWQTTLGDTFLPHTVGNNLVQSHAFWNTRNDWNCYRWNRLIQESRAVATKTRDAAAAVFGAKFTDSIHYKFKSSQVSKARLQSSKHACAKQNLTQNGHLRSFKVTCFGVGGKVIRD